MPRDFASSEAQRKKLYLVKPIPRDAHCFAFSTSFNSSSAGSTGAPPHLAFSSTLPEIRSCRVDRGTEWLPTTRWSHISMERNKEKNRTGGYYTTAGERRTNTTRPKKKHKTNSGEASFSLGLIFQRGEDYFPTFTGMWETIWACPRLRIFKVVHGALKILNPSHSFNYSPEIFGTDKTFDKDSVRAFKSLKAFKYFQAGYVQKIFTCLVSDLSVSDDKLFVCKSEVLASMERKVYKVFVNLSQCGEVLGGSCKCVSGLGAVCSHMTALLFASEDFVAPGINTIPDDATCTDELKQWNVPAKCHVEHKTINNITIQRPLFGKKPRLSVHRSDVRHVDDRSVNKTCTFRNRQEIRVVRSGMMKDVYTRRETTDPPRFISVILMSTKSMKFGLQMECQVKERYMKHVDKSLNFEHCELCVSKQFPFLCASPD
ncbi:LOW QUALITY PROTEIN: hypothetical protein KUTeg_011919 [Tegillarca granosa]|uniref:SWIM-type domain-containing protein n=1 Tax=Tegillarca granosa TaxID=220873 RepID=A0ABQ9EY11_TEGGR|nr:LOW QUALITY PROTEIN: hypothetical protein KUTeg_011919 [Tegillarca granosa]